MPEKLPHKRVLGEEEFGRLFNKCRIPFTTVANSYVPTCTMPPSRRIS